MGGDDHERDDTTDRRLLVVRGPAADGKHGAGGHDGRRRDGESCRPAGAGRAAASPGDIGWEGPSYGTATGTPSESKPESKLWYNDGKWWAVLLDAATARYFVYWLDISNQTWVKTGTVLDTRPDSRSDTLWDGAHLYVASHRFSASSTTATGTQYRAFLYRYSYNAANNTYSLDSGFPSVINQVRTETLVIDKDSAGSLWATWKADTNIYVAHSSVGGGSWGTPFILPGSTTVSTDDISSVLSFGSNQIGVMWSNQVDQKMYFSVHTDGTADSAWAAPEVAYGGTESADDHINLKGLADQNGRILAAVKTSLDHAADPLVHLLDRSAAGVWTSHVFGTGADNHTRPIVLIDSEHSQVHMFATAVQTGGSIYEKTAPLSNINFAPGVGTPVLTDADSAAINNATSTKQNVTSATGLVVLATNDVTNEYWTHYDPLGGQAGAVPVADAGPDQTVGTDRDVTLDATGSTVGGSAQATYHWDQVSGTSVTLSDPESAQPSFTASPDPDTLVFRVTVSTTNQSSTDDVTINVLNSPTANAGPDQTVNTNSDVTLDATGSFTGGSPLPLYLWQQISGDTVLLSDPLATKPEFTAPPNPDTLVFRVTVTTLDGSSTDDVTIHVVAPK